MTPIHRLVVAVLFTAVLASPAAALTTLGGLKLPAPATSLRASEDGRTAVAILQASGGASARLLVIDTADPQHPQAVGALDLPSGGEVALSSGGQLALLHLSAQRQVFNREVAHEVIAVDLSDRGAPRVLWRNQLSADKVVLSSQADTFAYSRLVAGKASEWEIVVSTVDQRQRAIVPDKGGPLGRMALSAHGNYLVQIDSRNLWIWNLKPATPLLFEQGLAFVERFAYACEPIVFESGHVVVADARVPRWNVYQAAAGVPRIAKLIVEETACGTITPNAGDRVFAFGGALGRVSMLDLRNPVAPKEGRSWQLPAATFAVAAARGVLFAVARDAADLRLFRMDSSGVTPVDWSALNDAHRSAMAALNAKRSAGILGGPWDAVAAIEAAGVIQALAAPVDGLSDQRAAAIFNDYGFLASQVGRPRRIAESALRRAIALDPGRALAHLNLADFLRADLAQFAATGGRVLERMQEIEGHYRAYIASGAKPSAAVSSYLRGDPGAEAKTDCEAIAMWTNAGRLQELVSSVGTDLPWNETRIDLVFTTQGTAHVPYVEAFDAKDRVLPEGSLADLQAAAENLWSPSQLGLITLRGRHHVIQYTDWNHPVETTPLNGGQACSFEVATQESVGTQATEPQMCRALQAGSIGATIEFNGESLLAADEMRETWRETEIVGTQAVDFGNAGAPQLVAELRLSSSAGAGCEVIFYDLLDADGTQLMRGPLRDRLMLLQAADPEGRYPVRCGNQARFYSHRNHIYFESKPAVWPPASNWDQYHRVATVRNDKIVEVCDFRFRSSVSVRR